MDRQSDVDLSSTEASVSNIPTATPIASEIISDFEPDPKFDITPLEKATFDCNDLLLQDSNLSELVQHPENGDQQEENVSNKLDKEQVSQDSGVHNAPNDYEDKAAKNILDVTTNREPKSVEERQTLSSQTRRDSELLTPSKDIPKINDCPSNFDKNENDADHLTATISLDESIAATALVEVSERADALGSNNIKDSDQNRMQYSAITTSQQTGQVHTNEGNDGANYLFSNSQTSVDALRDKVIESALELGEAHDFPHAPIQVEDREKLFESIHREVTGIQSSIDLIADVASQQESIEIRPAEPQTGAEQVSAESSNLEHSAQKQNTDLIIEEQVLTTKEDKHTSESQLEDTSNKQNVNEEAPTQRVSEEVNPEKSEDKGISTMSDEIICENEYVSEVREEPLNEVTELQTEPIIEEPLPTSDDVTPDDPDKKGLESEEPKEDLADIIVEPLTSADEAAETLNLEPVVEEASSSDAPDTLKNTSKVELHEQVKAGAKVPLESDVSTQIRKTAEAEEALLVEPHQKSGISKSEASSTEVVSAEETGRRKSGRKVKAPKLIDEELVAEEPRRGSRRISSRKRQETENSEEMKLAQPDSRAASMEKTDHLLKEVGDVESQEREQPAQSQQGDDKQPEKDDIDNEQIEPMDVAGKVNLVEQKESQTAQEPVSRSGRSLRVRVPKRKLEEETPDPEPPKKQVKRSRLSNDQLNKSIAPLRGTSIIKLPALKSRMTISTSDPSSRPGAHRERPTMATATSDKKYVCKECGFATDRLDNIVYHNTKSFCQGKSVMAEMMKNDIIKQQQSKGKRKQAR